MRLPASAQIEFLCPHREGKKRRGHCTGSRLAWEGIRADGMTFSTPPRGTKSLWCSHPLPTDIFRHDLTRGSRHDGRTRAPTTPDHRECRDRGRPWTAPNQVRDDTAIAGANSPCSKSLGARSCRHLRPADIFRHGTTDPAATRESPCFRLHHSSSTPPHRCHQLVGSPRSPQLNSLGTLTGHHPTEAVPPRSAQMSRWQVRRDVLIPPG